jgi:hypothetical protein
MDKIKYVLGQGREVKAKYELGKVAVPAATVTRLLNALAGKTGRALDREFYQGLSKYPQFLDALDTENISPAEALKEFQSLRPIKVAVTVRQRASGAAKAAQTFAKGIVKRFPGESPTELIRAFRMLVMDEEFSKELSAILTTYLDEFGTSNGHIKTSRRTANPKAMIALAKAREAKKKPVVHLTKGHSKL